MILESWQNLPGSDLDNDTARVIIIDVGYEREADYIGFYMANFKYAFSVISTNFDLEPVLQQYVDTYPQANLQNYQIVFKTEGEHQPESKSYIIVYQHGEPGRKNPRFSEFLQSYCTVNNVVAVANPMNHVFPDISKQHGHVLGRYEKK